MERIKSFFIYVLLVVYFIVLPFALVSNIAITVGLTAHVEYLEGELESKSMADDIIFNALADSILVERETMEYLIEKYIDGIEAH